MNTSVMNQSHPHTQHAGFSLIEVLVAVIVVTIGLLGFAKLQVITLQDNQTASEYTHATLLAYDIADRIRANPDGVRDGNYAKALGSCTAPAATASCESTACNPAQMAAWDISDWQTTINTQLPNPSCGITIAADSTISVSLIWQDKRSREACDQDIGNTTSCLALTMDFTP